MLDSRTKRILNTRPVIEFVGPKSTETIPELSPSQLATEREQRLQNLINDLDNVTSAAEAVEDLIVEKARDVELELNLDDPEDFVTAQACARMHPDDAIEIQPGVLVCTRINFATYADCLRKLKEHGRTIGQANQLPQTRFNPKKTDFGGISTDRRPQLNSMSLMIPPIDITAFITATVPILFNMLFPLISTYVNGKIIGHTHLSAGVSGAPTSPGAPVNPL